MKIELNSGEKHMLRLIRKGKLDSSWTPVSEILCPIVSNLPASLITFQKLDDGGLVKLTDDGNACVDWI